MLGINDLCKWERLFEFPSFTSVLSLPYLPDRMSAPVDDTHKLNEQVHTLLNGNWWAQAGEIGNAFPHLAYHHQGHKQCLSDPLTMHFKPFPSIRYTSHSDFGHQNAISRLQYKNMLDFYSIRALLTVVIYNVIIHSAVQKTIRKWCNRCRLICCPQVFVSRPWNRNSNTLSCKVTLSVFIWWWL